LYLCRYMKENSFQWMHVLHTYVVVHFSILFSRIILYFWNEVLMVSWLLIVILLLPAIYLGTLTIVPVWIFSLVPPCLLLRCVSCCSAFFILLEVRCPTRHVRLRAVNWCISYICFHNAVLAFFQPFPSSKARKKR